MIDKNLLTPLRKTLDKILLGSEEYLEHESLHPSIDYTNDEEYDVERSSN